MPILRAFRDQPSEGAETIEVGKGHPHYFTAATGGRKQDGIDLAGIPWDFSRAVRSDTGEMTQYPLLWVHDMTRDPMGVVDVIPSDDGPLPLRVALRFDPGDAVAVERERKLVSPLGGLTAVSIQWAPVDKAGQIVRGDAKPAANQLWEVSLVPVGMDEGAVKDGARVASMRALFEDLSAMLDGRAVEMVTETTETIDVTMDVTVEVDDDGDNAPDTVEDEATPERLAAEMVAIFEPHRWADDSDTERRAAYKALLPRYRRAGWTAPEFVPMVELAALDEAALRGLFLAGELARVGAELSTKNVAELRDIDAALRDASKRLGAMLSRVTSAKTPAAEDDAEDDTARGVGGDSVDDLVAAFRRLAEKETHNG